MVTQLETAKLSAAVSSEFSLWGGWAWNSPSGEAGARVTLVPEQLLGRRW